MSLGSRIASMRGFHRYTQAQLGGLIGVTKQTVSGWETNRRLPDANDLRKLCQTLDCTADYLLELTNDPHERVR